MANYLKLFNNHTEYEEYKNSGIELPIWSHCIKEVEVHYNPYVPPQPSHEYVEIGGLKWATCNVGAETPWEQGLYFQWGDTQGYTASQVGSGSGQKYFGWADYKYYDTSSSSITKYNTTDGKKRLDPEDDPVTAAWGSNWRMPTNDDWRALTRATNLTWDSSYRGFILTDKYDSSKVLYLPFGGICGSGRISSKGPGYSSFGYYWTNNVWSTEKYAYFTAL